MIKGGAKGIQKKSRHSRGVSSQNTQTVATLVDGEDDSDDREDYDLTPKHYIQTPILEETESSVEAELMRSRSNLDYTRSDGYVCYNQET